MQRASGLTGGRRVFARGTVVACGGMLAITFLLADSSTAATIDPSAGTWAPVSSPLPTSTTLASVSCVTNTDCWAVGSSLPKRLYYTVAEHWNGDTWTIVPTPGRSGDQLSSIDCLSSADCWSVGSTTTSVLIEHWNGSDWSIAHDPSVTGGSELSSVTCISSTNCWAVGDGPGATTTNAMAEHWDGSEWSVLSVPDGKILKKPVPTYLTGVSCVSAEDCSGRGQLRLDPRILRVHLSALRTLEWDDLVGHHDRRWLRRRGRSDRHHLRVALRLLGGGEPEHRYRRQHRPNAG